MQSHRASLLEASTNLVVGFAVSWWVSYLIIPWWFGVRASASETTQFVGVFTAITLVRSYLLRRLFNWAAHRLDARVEARADRLARMAAGSAGLVPMQDQR